MTGEGAPTQDVRDRPARGAVHQGRTPPIEVKGLVSAFGDRVILDVYVYAYHRMAATETTWHLWARLRDVFVQTEEGWRKLKVESADGWEKTKSAYERSTAELRAQWHKLHPEDND